MVTGATTDLRTRLQEYFHDTLDIAVTITPWESGDRLPPFFQDRYRFFKTQLMNLPCLLMADKNEQEESPARIRKHIDQARGKWSDPVVYVRERITAYNRKRLIEHKVPFIVPGTQMYLPMLGIDLREHFRKLRQDTSGLGPATQTVLIHALLQSAEDLNPTVLSGRLGYSVMTMSRALDELEAAGLGESLSSGRKRHLRLAGPKRALWEQAQPFLRTPVKSRHVIQAPLEDGTFPGLRSGLTALVRYSMLAEPENTTLAVGRGDWAVFRKKNASTLALPDEPGAMTVEVWSYAPALFAHKGGVDRLSLYLSLRDTQDERVQAALEQMMKEVSW